MKSEDSSVEIDIEEEHDEDFEGSPSGGAVILMAISFLAAIGLLLFLFVGTNTDRRKMLQDRIKTIEYENHLFLIYDRSMTHDPNCHCVSRLETDTPGLVKEDAFCGYQQGLMALEGSPEYLDYLDKREKALDEMLNKPLFRFGN
jgi:hypothetical protein